MTNNEIKTTEAELLNNYLDSIPSCDRKYFAREVVRRCGNGITMKTFYNWKYMSCRIPVFAKKNHRRSGRKRNIYMGLRLYLIGYD